MRKFALVAGLGVASPALADPMVIAALGDSLTQGYGLPAEEGFVPQLQDWLEGQGADVRLVNAGVSGDTSAGGLSRLDWTLTPEVEGLIVALGGNDLLRGIEPAATRANIEAILKGATERGVPVLLVGMRAPGNYGAEYKADFDALYPDLAGEYGAQHVESFLGALESLEDRQAVMRDYMQGDGLHPNGAGVALIVKALGPEVLKLVEKVETPS